MKRKIRLELLGTFEGGYHCVPKSCELTFCIKNTKDKLYFITITMLNSELGISSAKINEDDRLFDTIKKNIIAIDKLEAKKD